MKRRLLAFAALPSLLLSLVAAAAWAASHARPAGWRLVAVAHSADLVRRDGGRRAALFTTAEGWSQGGHHGFWDAWWVRGARGRLSLLAQVIDYEGTLRRVEASPPSLVVHPQGPGRAPAAVFARIPDDGSRAPGFGVRTDRRMVDGDAGPVELRAWIVTVPFWLLVLLGAPVPLLWWRVARRRRDSTAS